MVMYYQVKFEDGIYYICSKSRINKTTTSISVRYTGGAWYSATIIASNSKFKKRKLWSSDEKYVTRTYFKDELANDTYIHSDKILKLKSKYNEILKNRSVPMIKQWLEREKNAIKEQADGVNAKRSRYSSMEREILERSTEKHSFDGSEPSLAELEELIEEHDVLKHRSADSLLRKFRYMQRKSKECEEKK
ncbi:uncharacterized protein isoform X2 [Leptinotarsa decemlineata]|uniref:uncharacterized protein isoform X2 n=1 Tax=Leptinotarsa decemlineata TaxID=7539 RepID=UPI003D309127